MATIDRREMLRLLTAAAVGFAAAELGAVASEPPPRAERLLARRIPSSGETLPVIGLGTWRTFDVGPSQRERAPLAEVLREFVALGGRLVDTSPMYGRAEQVLGELAAAQGLLSELFIATKVWTGGRQAGIEQMRASMRRLGVRTLDLMQVHNLLDVDTHLETLLAWKREGRLRYIGITHYTAHAHEQIAELLERYPLDFVQINYSVGEREAENRLLPLARERGVAVIANRPFAGGGLLRRLSARPLPGWAAEIACASWAQLLLKFVISHPAVVCAIPATAQVAHLRDNMAAGHGPLPDEELRARIAAEAAA